MALWRQPEEWVARVRWDAVSVFVFLIDLAISGFLLFLLWRAIRG
jgi:hypothetical protein